MKKPKTIKLNHGERVVAAVPERCNGPGWSNAPTWVFIAANDGRMREECIQPDERTPELHTLFAAGEAMCNALAAAVPTRKTKTPNAPHEGPGAASSRTVPLDAVVGRQNVTTE